MKVQCPICYDSNKTNLEDGRLNLYKCNSCLHTFTVTQKKEEYHDDYFQKTHKNWFDNPNYELFDFIYEKMLLLLNNKKIHLLDVGCGKGDFLKYTAKKNSTAELSGIDLIDNQHPRIHFIKGDFSEVKIEAKFNVICSLAVIEHIDNPQFFVRKLNHILKPDGLLFIMTINNNSLVYRIARVLKKAGMRVAYDRLYSLHHLQHFTNQSLKTLLEINGFEVLAHKNHNYPIKAVDVPESNFLIQKMYKFFIWLSFLLSAPLGYGIHQTIVCRKRNMAQK